MNMKRVSLGGLVVGLLCLGAARAEDMPAPNAGPANPLFQTPGNDAAPAPAAEAPAAPIGPSGYVDYPRCLNCCGPIGRNGPISYEAYVRSGFNVPIGGNPFGSRLDVGWDIGVGARTLFFNTADDAAWTVDLGISNVHNHSSDQTSTYTLTNVFDQASNTTVPSVTVAVRDLNRTYFNLAGGREWYLWGNADCAKPETNLRVGFDLGGRYGTEKLDVTNIRHRTDTIAGVFGSVHSDLEIPTGCCLFIAGVRGEYGYTWGDILQRQNDGDVQEFMVLANLGLRF